MINQGVVVLLSKPTNDRCVISIGGWIGEFNNVNDIPIEFCLSFKNAVRTGAIVSTKIKAEKYSAIFIIDCDIAYIISVPSDGTSSVEMVDIDRFELINEFINDVRNSIDEWSKWPCYEDDSYESMEKKEHLLKLLEDLYEDNNLPF